MLVTDRVLPASTSEALASALSVLVGPSSVALPVTALVTTGASLLPVTIHRRTKSRLVTVSHRRTKKSRLVTVATPFDVRESPFGDGGERPVRKPDQPFGNGDRVPCS